MTHETLQQATLTTEGGTVESYTENPHGISGSASGLISRKAEDFATIVRLKQDSYADPIVIREHTRLVDDIAHAIVAGELHFGTPDDDRSIDQQVTDFINSKIAEQSQNDPEQALRQVVEDQAAVIVDLQNRLAKRPNVASAVEQGPIVPFKDRVALRQRFIELGATDEDIVAYDRVADFETALQRDLHEQNENTGSRFVRIVSTLSKNALGFMGIAPRSAEIETIPQR